MAETLQGLEGIEAYFDDILVHGGMEGIHDRCLQQALKVSDQGSQPQAKQR